MTGLPTAADHMRGALDEARIPLPAAAFRSVRNCRRIIGTVLLANRSAARVLHSKFGYRASFATATHDPQIGIQYLPCSLGTSLTHSTDGSALSPHEIPAAAHILARGMRDNPLHQAVFGHDAARVEPLLYAGFRRVLRQQLHRGHALGLHESQRLVAVAGMFAPGACLPNLGDRLAVLPALMRAGALHRLPRIRTWLRIWSRRDPSCAHWHLGPAAVERSQQGHGHGSRLLHAICTHLDSRGACGYLETDKQANVRLYRRFGFVVVATEDVLGITNWFMLRPVACATSRHPE